MKRWSITIEKATVLNVNSKIPVNTVLFGKFCILITLLLSFLNPNLFAQEQTKAFEFIKAGFSYQENVNSNDFHKYWSSKPALQIDLETPFYAGDIHLAGRYIDYNAKEDGLPGIHNFDILVGWGAYYPVFDNLKIGGSAGLLYSIYFFHGVTEEMIAHSRIYGVTGTESEIGFLLRADIVYQLNEDWGIQLNWNRNTVYTYHKIKLNYLGIGVFRKFNTPEWLRNILK